MKKVAGTLKMDQAQYRELEAFSKFSSDMDPITAMTIDKGRKNAQLLIQPQYSPMPVEQQIAARTVCSTMFPWKTYRILNAVSSNLYNSIIRKMCWTF